MSGPDRKRTRPERVAPARQPVRRAGPPRRGPAPQSRRKRKGGVQISARFYVIAVVLLCALAGGVYYLLSSGEDDSAARAQERLFAPAFPPTEIDTLASGWLASWVDDYKLHEPVLGREFRTDYLTTIGQPMRLNVYIPDEAVDRFPGYVFRGRGLTFIPALFLPPDKPSSLAELSLLATQPSDENFIVIGFPDDSVPLAGHAYRVEALLYWRSDLAAPDAVRADQVAPAPVFISDGYDELLPAELRAPTTQSTELGLVYYEGAQAVELVRAEWSAGSEVRLLVTLTNTSTERIPAWKGLIAATAQLPESAVVAGGPDREGSLAMLSALEAHQTITGFIVFPATVADPSKPLTLRFPGLPSEKSGEDDGIIIELEPPAGASEANVEPTTPANGIASALFSEPGR